MYGILVPSDYVSQPVYSIALQVRPRTNFIAGDADSTDETTWCRIH